jgi:hypothetical protein
VKRSSVLSAFVISLLWLGCNAIIGLDPGTPFCSDKILCNDSNPCTLDACSEELTCVFTTVPDGKSVEQVFGNCQTEICQGGLPTTVDNPADLPDDGEPCTTDACVNGVPSRTPVADGTACTKLGMSGVCAFGVCGCLSDADCDDTTPCTSDVCDATSHACAHWPLNNVPVPGLMEKVGDCLSNRCLNGAPAQVVDDTDVPNGMNACTQLGCNSGSIVSAPAPTGAPCSGASVCDGAGQCVECLALSDCTGVVETPCKKRSCVNKVCGSVNLPLGTVPEEVLDPIGDCKTPTCNSGNLVLGQNTGDLDNANPCTSYGCIGSIPSPSPVPNGQSCGVGLVCDGMSNCTGCLVATDCPQPPTSCNVVACNAGKCEYAFMPAMTVLPSGQSSNDCHVLVCDGKGHTVTIADDTDFAPGGCLGCLYGKVVPRTDQACVNMGQGGYCTAGGQCVACTRSDQCPDPGPCQVALCDAVTHTCGAAPAQLGVLAPPAQQTAGDCAVLVCDGMGGTTSMQLPLDVPVPSGPCTSGTCRAGTPTFSFLPKGTPCGAMTCDGSGNCL